MSGTPITSIRNLGPSVDEQCQRAGIPDAETLRALGAHEAYRKLLKSGTRPHFIGYYVLHMALQGRPWNDCKGKEKDALREQFDSLKSGTKADPLSRIEKELLAIGVVPRGFKG
ncbi:MAG: TfoX/Sxy family protein [Pelagimonas sp.]|uniref:TfoX/Sxy family protein n=1 Tax=Pelagimonas sp. TaxID=2073170 RepID=UPI003D6A5256